MHNLFEIPVVYNGEEIVFPAEVIRYGYVHRIQINIDGQVVYLEKDEEGSYRAIVDVANSKDIGKELIAAIVSSVESIIK
ncbi:MAG TPA: hypothetical protein VMY77_04010 [Chitinophagaceae bacterium]|nr:hypothetical protein [Chitinophagaceae bacterium]